MPPTERAKNGSYRITAEMAAIKDKIRVLRLERGLSTGLIAAELGLTRNMVIGHMTRMKLPPLTTATARKPRPAPKPKPAPAPPPPAAEPIVPLGLDLEALTPKACHWPYGEQVPYSFCGLPVAAGGNLCPAHHAIARPKSAAHGQKNGLSGQSRQKQQFGGR